MYKKDKQTYYIYVLYIFIYIYFIFYLLSIENHQFTLLSPILIQYHSVQSSFISIYICNFRSS